MSKVSAFMAISLDGFISGPGGSLEWLKQVEAPGEDYGYSGFIAQIDAVVMGRKTYEVVVTFEDWPFKNKEVWVLTKKEQQSKHGEKFSSSLESIIGKLKSEGKSIYLDGGLAVSSAIETNLLDELTLSLIPVLLGNGTKLFKPFNSMKMVRLMSQKSFPSGLVQISYQMN
jgi:dihydrofolate reductase